MYELKMVSVLRRVIIIRKKKKVVLRSKGQLKEKQNQSPTQEKPNKNYLGRENKEVDWI